MTGYGEMEHENDQDEIDYFHKEKNKFVLFAHNSREMVQNTRFQA